MSSSLIPMVQKALATCKAGELVRVPSGGTSILAIVLEPQGVERALLGFLQSPDFERPYPSAVSYGDVDVLSLGVEWVVAPVLPEHPFAAPNAYTHVPGALVIGPGGVAILFSMPTDMRRQGSLYVFGVDDAARVLADPTSFVSLSEWALWVSRDQLTLADAKPLFRFVAQAPEHDDD